jgi:peptide subunit release factor 1 (eRF1)
MDPGSAAHHAANGGALRSIRGTTREGGKNQKPQNRLITHRAHAFFKNSLRNTRPLTLSVW